MSQLVRYNPDAAEAGLIARVLPRLGDERAARSLALALAAEARKPPAFDGAARLSDCTEESVYAVAEAMAALQLYPGPAGHCFAIARKSQNGPTTATLQLGYKGLLELVRRSGAVKQVSSGVVYAAELEAGAFTWSDEPATLTKRGMVLSREQMHADRLVLAYCRVELVSGGVAQRVLQRSEIDARRARGGSRRFSPWESDYAAMARKSAIRALMTSGDLPMSAEDLRIIAEDARMEAEPVEVEQVRTDPLSAAEEREAAAVFVATHHEPGTVELPDGRVVAVEQVDAVLLAHPERPMRWADVPERARSRALAYVAGHLAVRQPGEEEA